MKRQHWIILAAVAVVGFLYWRSRQKQTSTVAAIADGQTRALAIENQVAQQYGTGRYTFTADSGVRSDQVGGDLEGTTLVIDTTHTQTDPRNLWDPSRDMIIV